MTTETDLLARLRIVTDKQSVDQAKEALKRLSGAELDALNKRMKIYSDQIDKLRDRYKAAREEVERMKQVSEALTSIGTKMMTAGAAITAPFVLAAKKYVDTVGQAESTSRRWLDSTGRLEQAQVRVGRVAAQQIVPYMEKAANLAEALARTAENNPGVIGKMLGLGVGLLAGGSLTTLLAQGIKLVADIKLLGAMGSFAISAKLVQNAADKMLTAAGLMNTAARTNVAGKFATWGPYAAAAAGAIGVGAGSFAVGQQLERQKVPLRGLTSTFAAANIPVWGPMIAAFSNLGQHVEKMGGMKNIPVLGDIVKFVEDLGKTAETTKAQTSGLTKEQLSQATSLYSQHQQESLEAERAYSEQRSKIVADYAAERARIEQQFEQRRTQIVRDFARAQAQALQDFERAQAQALADFNRGESEAYAGYQQQRTEAIQSNNQQIEQLERAHRDRLRQLALDHQDRLEGLVAARDALGIVQEQRQYTRSLTEENRSYQQERAEARKQMRQTLADMDAQYQVERAKRAEEFAREQAEAQAEFDIERQRAREAHARALADLDEQHRQEQQAAQQAFQQSLTSLRRNYETERQQRDAALRNQMQSLLNIEQQGHTAMVQETQSFVDRLLEEYRRLQEGTAGGSGSRLSGGYVSAGMWRLHDNEYVLNPGTTKALERMLRGPISQERLLARMNTAGGVMNAAQNLSVNLNFAGGSMNMQERRSIIAASKEEALAAIADALDKAAMVQ